MLPTPTLRARMTPLFRTLVIGSLASAAPLIGTAQPADPVFAVRSLETVNSTSDDYAPFLHPDGRRLMLTSSRGGSANLYVSMRAGDDWSVPTYLQLKGVNSVVDDGALSGPFPAVAQLYPLDAELSRALDAPPLALMTSGRRSDGEGDADIYLIRVGHDGVLLAEPTPLEEINTSGWDSQPSIAPDGRFIIFTSIRSEGEGGMDLFISMREPDGGYGEGRSLGAPVNTGGEELSPHIAPDGRTLFFSSTGHDGFGGADFFRTRLRDDGTWEPPVNLGPAINTSANEVFFYGAGRERCVFASDRDDGMGGLDLYEGTPNIFAPGFSTVRWQLRDTTTRRGIGGRMRIVETSRGGVIAETTIDPEVGVEVPMLAGFDYRVELFPEGFADTTLIVDDLVADRSIDRRVTFASAPPPPPPPPPEPPPPPRDFRLVGISVPLFVSGYYRLNMPELLEDLRTRQAGGDLKGETYITNVATDRRAYEQYRAMAERVHTTVDEFITRAINEDFPVFSERRADGESLEIIVSGYADPRPIIGTYDETAVSFLDTDGRSHTVSPGDSLDNLKLAGLRAHYAQQYLEARFRSAAATGHREYLELFDRGLIRWRVVSGNVDEITGGNNLAEKRRIRVEFKRVKRAER